MTNKDLAKILIALGVGTAFSQKRKKGSPAKLKLASAREGFTKEAETYSQKNLLLLAVREAVQNSLDAVRGAINSNQTTLDRSFINVFIDYDPQTKSDGEYTRHATSVYPRLIIQDTGIGMDEQRLDKFLTLLGSDKAEGDSGGWGVAKAVIFKISKSYKALVRTQDMLVPISGFVDDQTFEQDQPIIKNLPYYQGTTLIIEDIDTAFLPFYRGDPYNKYTGKHTYETSATFGDRPIQANFTTLGLVEQLLSCVGTTIPIYLTSNYSWTRKQYEEFESQFTPLNLRKATGPTDPYTFGFRPVPRSLNIGIEPSNMPYASGSVPFYSGKPLIKIDNASGRKTRMVGPYTLDKTKKSYLNANFYLGDKKDVGMGAFTNMLMVCIRLNDMFMFWRSESVTSVRLKEKIIVVDFFTNIKPYQEERYPVDKTREKLQSTTANIVRKLVSTMDRESVSAGANYEATIVLSQDTQGLTDFQTGLISKFMKQINVGTIKVQGPQVQAQLQKVGEAVRLFNQHDTNAVSDNSYYSQQIRKTNNIVYGQQTLKGNEDLLDNFVPSYYLIKSEYGPQYIRVTKIAKALMRAVGVLKSLRWKIHHAGENSYPGHSERESLFVAYIDMIIQKLDSLASEGLYYGEEDLGSIWSTFLSRSKEDWKSYGFVQNDVPDGYYHQQMLLPPLHLIFMDIRDVLYVFFSSRYVGEDWWQIAVAKLNILIGLFGSPSGFSTIQSQDTGRREASYFVQANLEAYSWFQGSIGFNSDEVAQEMQDFLDSTVFDHLGYSNIFPSKYVAYGFGINLPSVYLPKLRITSEYFPPYNLGVVAGWQNSKKQMKLLEAVLSIFSKGARPGGRDVLGCPVRIQAGEDWEISSYPRERDVPFALNYTYIQAQIVVLVQTLFQGQTKEVCQPHLYFGQPEEVVSLEYIMHFLQQLQYSAIANLSTLIAEDPVEWQRGGGAIGDLNTKKKEIADELKLVYKAIKAFHKEIPSRFFKAGLIARDLSINPFEGFCPVRYDLKMSTSDKSRVERNFLTYIPILTCWSTGLAIVDQLVGRLLEARFGKKRQKITAGLAFGPTAYSAMMQTFGNDSVFLWVNPQYYVDKKGKSTGSMDVWGPSFYSTIIHEYCHVIFQSDGHGQEYAIARDLALKITLPYLPMFLSLFSKILSVAPPDAAQRIIELQARLALRQAEMQRLEEAYMGGFLQQTYAEQKKKRK